MFKIGYFITNAKNTGPINQTLNIIRNMDRNKFAPHLITLFPENNENSLLAEFEKLEVKIFKLELSKVASLVYGKSKLYSVLSVLDLDLLHSVGMPLYNLARMYPKTKQLTTIRNDMIYDYPVKYGKILGFLLAKKDLNILKNDSKENGNFVVCSQSLSEIYKSRYSLNFNCIRNGIDINKYYPSDYKDKERVRNKLGLPNKKIIVYTGAISTRKDQYFAVNEFLGTDGAEELLLLIVGGGEKLTHLKEQFGEKDNVVYTGRVDNVPEYLRASDAYLSTSKSEGLPNGVLEAMATKLPVFLSNIPQHIEILKSNQSFGMSYELGDSKSFKTNLKQFINEDWDIWGERALEILHSFFSADKMSKDYQNLYEQIINS